MKKFLTILILAAIGVQSYAANKPKPDSILKIMDKVADWQLNEWQQHRRTHPAWDWTMGACYPGYIALNQVGHNPKYINAMPVPRQDQKRTAFSIHALLSSRLTL